MAWNTIIGQDRIKNILQKAILDNRVPSAYCFWGIEGIGKEALALEFAKVANCKEPKVKGSEVSACDKCSSCKLANSLQHPNIEFVYALPTPKNTASKEDNPMSKLSDEQIESVIEQKALKAENPYHKITFPNANQIKISTIRELKRSHTLSAVQRGRRFIIVSRAEEMTVEAANAFLKMLEEPSSNVTIILVTSRHDTMLQTILSRTQQIHCELLSDEALAIALSKNKKLSQAEARLISAFAQGSYTNALEFLDENMKVFRQEVVDIFRNSLKKRIFRDMLFTKLEEYFKKKDKNLNEKLLKLLHIWFRDAFILSQTRNAENLINIDQKEVLQRFVDNFGEKDLLKAINLVEKSIMQIKRNVQAELIFLSLFIKLRAVFLK